MEHYPSLWKRCPIQKYCQLDLTLSDAPIGRINNLR